MYETAVRRVQTVAHNSENPPQSISLYAAAPLRCTCVPTRPAIAAQFSKIVDERRYFAPLKVPLRFDFSTERDMNAPKRWGFTIRDKWGDQVYEAAVNAAQGSVFFSLQ